MGLLAVTMLIAYGQAGTAAAEPSRLPREGTLEIYYSPPVLVGAGERVGMPVDVACSSPSGVACEANLTVGARQGPQRWAFASAKAGPGIEVDLTALAGAAGRAAHAGGTASVRFFLRAGDDLGRTIALPTRAERSPLSFYVVSRLRTLDVPPVGFGEVREPRTVLFLPWGTGKGRAGLSLGAEAPTLGPPAYDVDASGRIHLLDVFQGRVAVFEGGALVHEDPTHTAALHDIGLSGDGAAFTIGRRANSDSVVVRTIGSDSTEPLTVGEGIPSAISVRGSGPYIRLLPLDAWIPAIPDPGASRWDDLHVGRPLDHARELLSVVRGNALRLGVLDHGNVEHPIELRFHQAIGEAALAEPFGRGGYLAVVRVWREGPAGADQYQVVTVGADDTVNTFAVASDSFAEANPLSRFRVGRNGALYQMTSSSDGLRIVRFDLGGDR